MKHVVRFVLGAFVLGAIELIGRLIKEINFDLYVVIRILEYVLMLVASYAIGVLIGLLYEIYKEEKEEKKSNNDTFNKS